MRSPVLLGATAGVVVALLALVTVIALLASVPLQAGAGLPDAPGRASAGSAGAPAPSAAGSAGAPAPSAAGSGGPGAEPGTGGPGASASEAAGTPRTGTAVGDLAPPLVADRLGGGTIDLAQLRGQPVWVNFMATWCPACRDELPLMQGYQAELGARMAIVLVDVREDPATVASFASSLGITLPIGLDTNGRAQDAWGAFALPIHYWIDAAGVVRAVAFGTLAPPQFHADVQTVLPGVQLQP